MILRELTYSLIVRAFSWCQCRILPSFPTKIMTEVSNVRSSETGIPGESQSPWTGFELTTLLVICTDCTSRYKSNYHAIRTTMVLFLFGLIISRIYFKLECQGDLCVLICYWMNVMLLFSMTLVMMSFNIYVEFNDAPSHLQLFTPIKLWARTPFMATGFLRVSRFPPPIKLTSTI
jgi:hypothetical protein